MADTQTKINNRAAYFNYGFIELSEPPAGGYDSQSWAVREQEYIASLDSIVLPVQMDPDDLVALNAIIDQVSTIAFIEDGNMQRALEYFKTVLRNREKMWFNQCKQAILTQNPGQSRATEAEVNSELYTLLNTMPFDQALFGTSTIYDLYFQYHKCYTFTQSVINILKEKSAKLITNSAAMKFLAQPPGPYPSQNGGSGSYPQQGQYTNYPQQGYGAGGGESYPGQ